MTYTQANIRQLAQKKYRYQTRTFIVEGVKGVHEAILSDCVEQVVFAEGRTLEQALTGLFALAGQKRLPIETWGLKAINKCVTTETFSGVLAVARMRENVISDFAGKAVLCLDKVSDPGNLGTIIRTADWFGIENILLSEDCVDPYNEKVVRSTMGSLFHVKIAQSDNLLKDIDALRKKEYSVIAFTLNGKPLQAVPKQKKVVYVFGSESHGVRQELLDVADCYTIPGKGKAESLNVGVAVGIALSHIILYLDV